MNTYSDITSDGGYDPRNVLHKALDPLVGDMYQDEHGEVYVYTGSEWRLVVTPEKQAEQNKPQKERQDFMDGYDAGMVDAKRIQQAEQEPIGYWQGTFNTEGYAILYEVYRYPNHPVYAAPVRVQDLTDDELHKIRANTGSEISFARAAIAADREKNKA